MKALLFPGRGNKNENRYIDIVGASILKSGVRVSSWVKEMPFQSADIFHVHWPEVVTQMQLMSGSRKRGDWIYANFFSTLNRVKDRGGGVIWTVHDLKPHNALIASSEEWNNLRTRLLPLVDIFITLTGAAEAQIRTQFDLSDERPIRIARHPHYLNIFRDAHRRTLNIELTPPEWRSVDGNRARKMLDIPLGATVGAVLGSLRTNKGVLNVVKTFVRTSAAMDWLIIAGEPSPDVGIELLEVIGSHPRIRYMPHRLSENDLISYHFAADFIVFGGVNYFNTGAIYTALSLGCPIFVEETAINREISALSGSGAIHFLKPYDPNLNWLSLTRAVRDSSWDWLGQIKCFDPELVGTQHLCIYKECLRS